MSSLRPDAIQVIEPMIGVDNARGLSTRPTSRAPVLRNRTLLVWELSLGIWLFATLALATSSYVLKLAMGDPAHFLRELAIEACNVFTFAPMTPFAFALGLRYQIHRRNWRSTLLVLLAGGVGFTLAHVLIQGITPYAVWDTHSNGWVSGIGFSKEYGLQIHWHNFERLLISTAAEDIIFIYTSIVLIAHAVAYHQSFREGELRKSQLESQLALARLQTLKSQLQPHFLFNTLHSISSLMHTDVDSADQMMSLLSDLLRTSLSNHESHLTTLGEELRFVDTYLEIESIRFENRLRVTRDIAANTRDVPVPHLLLQPIVENAVRHGVLQRAADGQIRICAKRSDDHLHLWVTDNGPGLSEAGPRAAGTGLGLHATRERLRTLYADDFEMTVRTAPAGGVEVFIRLPCCTSNAFAPLAGVVGGSVAPP